MGGSRAQGNTLLIVLRNEIDIHRQVAAQVLPHSLNDALEFMSQVMLMFTIGLLGKKLCN